MAQAKLPWHKRLLAKVVAAHKGVSTGLEVAGSVSIAGGFAWIYPPLGPIIGGFLMVGLGFLIGLEDRK